MSEEKKNLPVVSKGRDLKTSSRDLVTLDPLKIYLKEISKYSLLSREQESELVAELQETGDIEVAKKLVMANLRLVVKIAMEYRRSYSNVMDLIQEGNIGLMKGVSKYNPDKGSKLSYYASWWIRSYILKFILDNFRLVKVGTTAEQKKLFYNLMREKQRLLSMGITPDAGKISKNLGVSEKAVIEMDKRIGESSGDFSIDFTHNDSSGSGSSLSLGDSLSSGDEEIDDSLGHLQELSILQDQLGEFMDNLKPRDLDIFKKRLLDEAPMSLQAIANDYGVSRERIRQIEARLLEKLKVYMGEYLR